MGGSIDYTLDCINALRWLFIEKKHFISDWIGEKKSVGHSCFDSALAHKCMWTKWVASSQWTRDNCCLGFWTEWIMWREKPPLTADVSSMVCRDLLVKVQLCGLWACDTVDRLQDWKQAFTAVTESRHQWNDYRLKNRTRSVSLPVSLRSLMHLIYTFAMKWIFIFLSEFASSLVIHDPINFPLLN